MRDYSFLSPNPQDICAEQKLWRAVLIQALSDACGFFDGGVPQASVRRVLKARAQTYLRDAEEGYQDVCLMASVCPQAFHRQALALMTAQARGEPLVLPGRCIAKSAEAANPISKTQHRAVSP